MDIKILRNIYAFENNRASERDLQMERKGPFTLSISIDSGVDVWKEFIGLNFTIHTKRQDQHQH